MMRLVAGVRPLPAAPSQRLPVAPDRRGRAVVLLTARSAGSWSARQRRRAHERPLPPPTAGAAEATAFAAVDPELEVVLRDDSPD
jgi:hypothetical protein